MGMIGDVTLGILLVAVLLLALRLAAWEYRRFREGGPARYLSFTYQGRAARIVNAAFLALSMGTVGAALVMLAAYLSKVL